VADVALEAKTGARTKFVVYENIPAVFLTNDAKPGTGLRFQV